MWPAPHTLHDSIARRCTSAPHALPTGRRGCLTATGGVWTIGPAACTRATSATLARQLDAAHHSHIADPTRTPLRAPSSSVLHRSSPACGGACDHVCSAHSASAPPMCTRCFARPPPRRRRGSGASAGPHRMTRREPPTFPSSAAAGAAPPRSPVLASRCRGRTSRGVTTTMRPTPGTRPRVSTLATPHAWLRSSLPSSAGPPPGSAAKRPRARARGARARTHVHAHAHTHAHACSHVCSLLLPCLAFCPARSHGLMLSYARPSPF